MAGRYATKAENEQLRQQLQDATAELSRLKRLLASVEPSKLRDDGEAPAAVETYSADVNERVLAMADEGMTEAEWIARLGLSSEGWANWKTRYPELAETVQRAKARTEAYYSSLLRDALESGNTRFPVSVLQQAIRQLRAEDERGSSGDASKLVVVDLTEGEDVA